jgi:hypothetical protein
MPEFLSTLRERFAEIQGQEWQRVTGAALAGAIAFAIAMLYFGNHGQRWVFPIDNANLAFHEFGHPFFGTFSERLMVYGGTLGQLAFPLATTIAFWIRREAASCAVCAIWFFENLFNIARYMADARAHQLPLVGGLNPELYHDWTEIFVRWHALPQDTKIAAFTSGIGWVGIFASVMWLAYVWYRQSEDD